MKTTILSIIIVNWNSGNQLRECLASVNRSKIYGIKLNLIVIDNASSDNSLDDCYKIEGINIIKNERNLGFSASCNIGFKLSEKSDFTLLLNPDTVIGEETLQESIDYMIANRHISILGCKHLDIHGHVSASCARSPKIVNFIWDILGFSKALPSIFHGATIMYEKDYNKSMYVDQVIGAYMMISNELFDRIGYFDERFFVYYEEADFSYRSKLIEAKTFYNADISIFHKGGGTSENVKAKRLFYSLNSRLLYGFKHFNIIEKIVLVIITLFIEPITRIIFLLISFKLKEIPEALQAYLYLYRTLILREKKYFG